MCFFIIFNIEVHWLTITVFSITPVSRCFFFKSEIFSMTILILELGRFSLNTGLDRSKISSNCVSSFSSPSILSSLRSENIKKVINSFQITYMYMNFCHSNSVVLKNWFFTVFIGENIKRILIHKISHK